MTTTDQIHFHIYNGVSSMDFYASNFIYSRVFYKKLIIKTLALKWASCICHNFEFYNCQNNRSCHNSEWTFAGLSLVRMNFFWIVTFQNGLLQIVTCQNGLLTNCHLSELTFAKLAYIRMNFLEYNRD